jgi:hypothetical protein
MKLTEQQFKDFINWLDEQKDFSSHKRLILQLIAIQLTYTELTERVYTSINNKRYDELKNLYMGEFPLL